MISVFGTNHRYSTVETREKIAFRPADVPSALKSLGALSIKGAVILSTCNRMEIYVQSDMPPALSRMLGFIESFHGVKCETGSFYEFHGMDAVRHLMKVAASLDSMVVGEPQILGQVRSAFQASESENFLTPGLTQAFLDAFAAAREIRRSTAVGEGSVSVSSICFQLAKDILGDFAGKNVLLIGAGKMTELTLDHFKDLAPGGIFICNRTWSKAQQLAQAAGASPLPFEDLENHLKQMDFVVSSTSAQQTVITYDMTKRVMQDRKRGPLFLVDISVPRDIDPAVLSLPDVHLYNIDDLAAVRDGNMQRRLNEVPKAEAILDSFLISRANHSASTFC